MNKEEDKHQASSIKHRPLKIGIDISPVVYGTGVSNYIKNLVSALLAIDKKEEFVLFGGSLRRKRELDEFISSLKAKNSEGKTYYLPPTFLSFLWNELHTLSAETLTGKLDVFHSSDWAQPPSKAYKVTTIHDLVPLRFPEISDPKVVSAHKKRLHWVRKEVDKIIAVSEFTKREIIELLGIEPKRIVVIPEAPGHDIKRTAKKEVERVKRKYKIKRGYLLVAGADPRKNIPAIVQAYRQLITHHSSPITLVIVGRPWEKIPDAPGILKLGHVSREELSALYSGAQALVYTSLYEGFGLPILEAMACGTPVVTSNISSMPEVADNAAVQVDPTNPTEIAAGIEKVLSEREKWVDKGKRRVKMFSWEKTARKTLEVYRGHRN